MTMMLRQGREDTAAAWMDWLQLARSRRVGPATFHRLLRDHGSAAAALAALPGIAAAAGVENYEICPIGVVRAEAARGAKFGATLLLWGQDGYPEALMDLADAPPILWAFGDISLLTRPGVALVGARNASSLGLRMAKSLAAGLGAAGQVVVSGLARGIDAAAHEAALATGTIAVQAGGLDVIYPEENAALTEAIGARGLRVSEQPFGMAPQARHFPQRNRIVSGLARAVVVVEAAAKSGSLITARDGADQGRDVLAVPGHPFDARAAGCNALIRDGAVLVRSAADVIEALGLPVLEKVAQNKTAQSKAAQGEAAQVEAAQDTAAQGEAAQGEAAQGEAAQDTAAQNRAAQGKMAAVENAAPQSVCAPHPRDLRDISALHSQILGRLGPSPVAEDQLLRDIGAPSGQAGSALIALELEGLILRHAGGLLSRAL